MFPEDTLDCVRQAMRVAISGPTGFMPPRFPADTWTWVRHGQLLRARLLGRLAIARDIPDEGWIPIAAALELVHAASLLHDDVIDGTLLRRHAPALWTRYGPRLAILAGDYLLAAAFDMLDPADPAMRSALSVLPGAARLTCTAEIDSELCAQSADRPPRQDDLVGFARGKTGPLFAVATVASLPSDAPPRLRGYWREIGFEIGLIYQISDDLSDSDARTGKTPGRDAARQLATTASFATPRMLRERFDALKETISASAKASAPEKEALVRFLDEDLFPALRPLA